MMMINGQNRTISRRIVQLREVVQVKQRLNGGSFLSCSQDRSSCADPSRNRTLEVQIVRFMGKSFVIIVLEVLLQRSVQRIPFSFVDVSLSSELSSEKKGGTSELSTNQLMICFLLHPSVSYLLRLPPLASFLSRNGQMLTASRFSYPSILIC